MSTEMHEPTRTDWRHTPLSRMPKHGPEAGDTPGRLGGVVAGVSHAFDFDVRTTRIAFAVATIILPVLAAVYVVAWLLLPDTPSRAQSLEQIVHDRRRLPLLAVLALVVVVGIFGSFGSWFLYRGAPWGFVLIGLGVLLWVSTSERFATPRSARTTSSSRTGRSRTAAPASGAGFPPPTPEDAAPTWSATAAATVEAPHITRPVPVTDPSPTPTPAYGTPVYGTPTTPAYGTPTTAPASTAGVTVTGPAGGAGGAGPSAPAPTHHRRTIPIASIGTGVAVLWFALVGIGNALDWWHVANLWVLVAGLGIVLTSMLVSIVVNRSWVLPFLFLPLLFAVVALCVTQPNIDGSSGERTVRPATVAEATTRQHLATGQLTIDLRDVPLGGDTVVVTAEVGMGRLRVLVPADADLVLHTDTGAGQAQLDGSELSSGVRQENDRTVAADTEPATGSLRLDLRVGMGQIDVERVAG